MLCTHSGVIQSRGAENTLLQAYTPAATGLPPFIHSKCENCEPELQFLKVWGVGGEQERGRNETGYGGKQRGYGVLDAYGLEEWDDTL